MNRLEQDTLADGFRICLLEVWRDRASGRTAFLAKLFDGGRQVDSVEYEGRLRFGAEEALNRFVKLLYRVAAPPHVLAGFGLGWRELLAASRPDLIPGLRILDLHETAVALDETLRAGAGTGAIARAYGIAVASADELFLSSAVEQVLWAVVRRAGERGLAWPDLLAAGDAARRKPDFSRYDFDETTIAQLPPRPGVYVMRDGGGRVLYVGKTVNLARRLGEYFRANRELPPKLVEIRERIRRFSYTVVGSELEALLLENRLIAELEPAVNVQRAVADGRGRYGTPLLPVVVIERSARAGQADLFFLSGARPAVQVTVDPRKPAGASLRGAIAYFAGSSPRLRRTRSMKDWGRAGGEIGTRYFMRARSNLQWLELREGIGPDELLRVARLVLETEPPAGEFRFSSEDGKEA